MDPRRLGFDPSPPIEPEPTATDRQLHYLRSIAEHELQMTDWLLESESQERFGCRVDDLTKAQASDFIDELNRWSEEFGGRGKEYY